MLHGGGGFLDFENFGGHFFLTKASLMDEAVFGEAQVFSEAVAKMTRQILSDID